MDAGRAIGRQVLELLAGVDLAHPSVDRERAASCLQAYVKALGLSAPRVRWAPDLRALRESRVYSGKDRGHWRSFVGRERWLLNDADHARWAWRPGGFVRVESSATAFLPALRTPAQADRLVLDLGLGRSPKVRGVRRLTLSLDLRARELASGLAKTLPARIEALRPLAEAAEAGLFAYTVGRRGEGDIVALSRPTMRVDEEGRLHDWDGGMAVEWPDGRGMHYWRGVLMTDSAGRNPEAVTPRRILSWSNAERRRVAIERFGLGSFTVAAGAVIVQEDDFGRLWRLQPGIDGEPLVVVEVVNSTLEPDGTARRHFLRVPPETKTARQAVAWTFGFKAWREYEIAAES